MKYTDELKYRFQYATPVMRLIFVNGAVFLGALLVNLFAFLFLKTGSFSAPYLSLPSSWPLLFGKPWTILTYQFTQFGAFHFLFNMLVLYFSGNIFLDFFRKKDVWRVYIWGGVVAGLLFMMASNYLPAFKGGTYTLVGASGSVMAILFAATIYAPHIRLQLFGVFPVKLYWIAIAYVVLDLLSISESNAGGHIAHIGGAAFGTLYALYRKNKIQIRLFEPVIKPATAKKAFKVQVNQNGPAAFKNQKSQKGSPTQEEIDAILDKISRSGYDRLSKEEKDILFKASQD